MSNPSNGLAMNTDDALTTLQLHRGSLASAGLADITRKRIAWLRDRLDTDTVLLLATAEAAALAPVLSSQCQTVRVAVPNEEHRRLVTTEVAASGEPARLMMVDFSDLKLALDGPEAVVLGGSVGEVVFRAASDLMAAAPPDRLLVMIDTARGPRPSKLLEFLEGKWKLHSAQSFVGPGGATRHLALDLRPGHRSGPPLTHEMIDQLFASPRAPVDEPAPLELAPAMIFFLSTGRSGSASIAAAHGLLHEPDGPNPAIEGVQQRARYRAMYGETSHFWKAHIPELRAAFPHARLIHLVRDGQKVVKSFQSRGLYRGDRGDLDYRNAELAPFAPDMSRFERLCWYWRHWNERIEEEVSVRVKLEDLRLPVTLNRGSEPAPWEKTETETYEEICGPLARRYGYS